ncbi:hypothetical protein [Paraburkholderia sp.]|uniref:hypothetical protein n=1 Tax=Paraburkholderia sp. TaxID=1926495 RepID=UPI003C7A1243
MQKARIIRLGITGRPMAEDLIKSGVAPAAFTRTGIPETLTQAGAVARDSHGCGRGTYRRDLRHCAGYAGRGA